MTFPRLEAMSFWQADVVSMAKGNCKPCLADVAMLLQFVHSFQKGWESFTYMVLHSWLLATQKVVTSDSFALTFSRGRLFLHNVIPFMDQIVRIAFKASP